VEPLDLVFLARCCDQLFDGDPSARDFDPELFALVDDGTGVDFMRYGTVDHYIVAFDVVPPPGCVALILLTAGWSAPFDPEDSEAPLVPPSAHPDRRRVFSTTVIGNDGEIVTAMRTAGDPELQVLAGECAGRVPEALRRCWARRRTAAA
jgi:hypothetical protein